MAHQAPLSMEFSRQEYWSGLPFPPPGDLPTQGSNLSLVHCQVDSLPPEQPRKPYDLVLVVYCFVMDYPEISSLE